MIGLGQGVQKNWVRLIQKIYEIDAITCAKCGERMKILSFMEDLEIIKKILKHLDWWDLKARPPTKRAKATPSNIHIDYSYHLTIRTDTSALFVTSLLTLPINKL